MELLELSVEKGADIDMQNRWGDTPLHFTCHKGLYETTNFLLSKGASANILNFLGEAPIHKAIQSYRSNQSLKIVKLLINNGADWKISSLFGRPLFIAKSCNAPNELIEYLQKLEEKDISTKNYNVHITSSSLRSGPSFDNIDLPSLLGIRHSESVLNLTVLTELKSNYNLIDIVEYNDGFRFECGNELAGDFNEIGFDLKIEDDLSSFDYGMETSENNVVNIIGRYKAKKDLRGTPYFVISVLKTSDLNSKYRGVIRTITGDHRFFIPAASLKSKPSSKEILKLLEKEIPELSIKGVSKCVIIDDVNLQNDLLSLEKTKSKQYNRLKVGVILVKANQTDEQEILSNEQYGQDFEDFLDILGEKIPLLNWKDYSGDMNTTNNYHGEYSRYTKFRNFEIMFHVGPYIPDSGEEECLSRKRLIGNDITTIVFLEKGAKFKPPCISGDFLHIFVVVSPTEKDGKQAYKISVISRDGVPPFGPPLPSPPIFTTEGTYFRDFLLTKLINGERGSLHSPYLISKMYRTRQMLLENYVRTYAPNLIK